MVVRPYTIPAPVQPQYVWVDGRSTMLRQPLDQSRSSTNGDQSTLVDGDKNSSSSKFSVPTLLIGALIGLVICGIPLAIITTLYIREKSDSSSSSGSSSNSGSSGTGSVTLPSQCSSYAINAESTRSTSYSCSGCYCDSSLTTGWYRFISPAGTQLSTTPISTTYCGTSYPGWFNGSFPTTAGTTTSGTVCVNMNGNICYSLYSVSGILVTHCDTFYVFYLRSMSYCSTRYCAS